MHRDVILFGIQSVIALLINGMATFAATAGDLISGDALIGLYGATVGYVFGFQSGSRHVSVEGPTIVDRREGNAVSPQ